MSGPSTGAQQAIRSKDQLVNWFASACAKKEDLKIGMEHEKPPFYLADNAPATFLGQAGRAGVRDFFEGLARHHGWTPGTIEQGNVIDLAKGGANWTLEPALQVETGGAPYRSVHDIARETKDVIAEAVDVADRIGMRLVATGFHPTHRADTLEIMKKSRYDVYRDYVAREKFPSGLDLIACTSTVQANLGFTSEQDFVRKIRASLNAATSIIALYATSPFADGKPTGYDSYRSHMLRNGWGGRYGFMLPVAFEKDFGFERYTDFVLEKMPMIGFYEGHIFKPAYHADFKDFMAGNFAQAPGRIATLGDWSDLLNTVWPDTRPRKLLEMRSADVAPPEMIPALAAFWKGLLYDDVALDAALDFTSDWTNAERDQLRDDVPRTGLQTKFRNGTVQDIARQFIAIAADGLQRQANVNGQGQDERMYLAPLQEIADSGLNWSRRLTARFNTAWKGDISHLFKEMDYAAAPSVLGPAPAIPLNRKVIL